MRLNQNYRNILIEGELNNQIQPVTHRIVNVAPKLDFEKFKNSIPSYIFDTSSDSRIALKTIYGGKQIRRMYDAKNNLIKKNYTKFFESELNDNEKRIWWEEQEDFNDLTPIHINSPVDKYKHIY